MTLPYYWKRGLIAGAVVGVTLHLLLAQLAARQPVFPMGNLPVDATTRPKPQHQTSLGPLMGLTIFALCCVMPGPNGGRVGGR